jgi:hypothetical protein
MERIYTADDPMFIGYLKSLLEAEGIACNVRNELLGGGSGELPPNECWPELWILQDTDVVMAKAIVATALENPSSDGEPWTCSHCGEPCEAQFSACWRCGSLHQGV